MPWLPIYKDTWLRCQWCEEEHLEGEYWRLDLYRECRECRRHALTKRIKQWRKQ